MFWQEFWLLPYSPHWKILSQAFDIYSPLYFKLKLQAHAFIFLYESFWKQNSAYFKFALRVMSHYVTIIRHYDKETFWEKKLLFFLQYFFHSLNCYFQLLAFLFHRYQWVYTVCMKTHHQWLWLEIVLKCSNSNLMQIF